MSHLASMSQLQLKEVVSPLSTILGTLTRRLLRPTGPDNNIIIIRFIGKIIKITLVKTVTIWLWRTKTGNFLGQKHWKKLHSNKINEQYRFLSETFCRTITYLRQILTKLRHKTKYLTFSKLLVSSSFIMLSLASLCSERKIYD